MIAQKLFESESQDAGLSGTAIVRHDFFFRTFGDDADHFEVEAEALTQAEPGKTAPFVYAGSGYPVSSSSAGVNGAEALRRIAGQLHQRNYSKLEEFDGPFLVVIFVPSEKRLLVARDKFGLRCAYYASTASTFTVSDNISRVTEPAISKLRIGGILEWLHYGSPMVPLTFFENVMAIPAGHVLEIDGIAISKRLVPYFCPQDYVSSELYESSRGNSVPVLKKTFESVFMEAVSRTTHGRRDVSILLSGGVDSSLLSSFTRRVAAVSAVTLDIYGPGSESEKEFASAVATHLGLKLLVCRFGPPEFVTTFCQTIRAIASPLIIENAVALHFAALSGDIPRQQLILDGEGADALMAGSTPLFKFSMTVRFFSQFARVGSPAIRSLLQTLRRLLARFGLESRSTLDGPGLDVDLGARRMELGYLTEKIGTSFHHLRSREEREIATLMLREFYDYLVPLMLRLDKMSAGAASHTVLPYLSGPVFRFLENLEMKHKLDRPRGSLKIRSKGLLKSVLEDHIPASLVRRPKVGFGIPAWTWINFPEPWRRDSFVANAFRISEAAFDHWNNVTTSRDKLFLLSLEVWGRLFIWGRDFDEVQDQWLSANDPTKVPRAS